MRHFQYTTIGTFHTNHNEDFSVIAQMENDKTLIAIMDGCSMGTESQFAAILLGKLLRKMAKAFFYQEFIRPTKSNIQEDLKSLLSQLFVQLQQIKNQWSLETEELLTTLILGVVDTKEKKAEIIIIGDGLIAHNGTLYDFDQNDKPDYLAYHLQESFPDWFAQQQFLSLEHIQDLSIASDGIYTFKKFDHKRYKNVSEEDIIHFLLQDQRESHQQQMLLKKVYWIEKNWGLKPSDDLTIIRLLEN